MPCCNVVGDIIIVCLHYGNDMTIVETSQNIMESTKCTSPKALLVTGRLSMVYMIRIEDPCT